MKQQLQLLSEQLSESFERLSAREQIMALFLVAAILLMALGFGSYFVNRGIDARQRRIAAKEKKLVQVGELRTDYQRRLNEQRKIANRVRGNNRLRLLSYLEDKGKLAGIELKNIVERPGEPTGSDQVKEESAEVLVKKVSIDRLFKFLKQVEQGNPLIKVRRLKIKQRFDDKEMLDASVTVGTFKTTS